MPRDYPNPYSPGVPVGPTDYTGGFVPRPYVPQTEILGRQATTPDPMAGYRGAPPNPYALSDNINASPGYVFANPLAYGAGAGGGALGKPGLLGGILGGIASNLLSPEAPEYEMPELISPELSPGEKNLLDNSNQVLTGGPSAAELSFRYGAGILGDNIQTSLAANPNLGAGTASQLALNRQTQLATQLGAQAQQAELQEKQQARDTMYRVLNNLSSRTNQFNQSASSIIPSMMTQKRRTFEDERAGVGGLIDMAASLIPGGGVFKALGLGL